VESHPKFLTFLALQELIISLRAKEQAWRYMD